MAVVLCSATGDALVVATEGSGLVKAQHIRDFLNRHVRMGLEQLLRLRGDILFNPVCR